jgi:ABC-type glycerol-3-phosphate transport system substrate-binding protein
MKKAITLTLALVLALSLLTACGGKDTGTGSAGGGSTIPASSDEYRRGMNLLQEEKYEEAVAAFTEAIANESKSDEP